MRSEKDTKGLYNGITGIDDDIIEGAQSSNPHKKATSPVWMKWGAIAACFALAAVLGVGALQGGWFRGNDIENHETAYKPGIMFENELFLLSASKSDVFEVDKQEMDCVGAIQETVKGSELPVDNFQASGNEDLLGCNIYTMDRYPACLFVWDENGKLYVYERCDED